MGAALCCNRSTILTHDTISTGYQLEYLNTQADFATAKQGDVGYCGLTRGVYGTFRLDQGTLPPDDRGFSAD